MTLPLHPTNKSLPMPQFTQIPLDKTLVTIEDIDALDIFKNMTEELKKELLILVNEISFALFKLYREGHE
jgi:hypothetical protein